MAVLVVLLAAALFVGAASAADVGVVSDPETIPNTAYLTPGQTYNLKYDAALDSTGNTTVGLHLVNETDHTGAYTTTFKSVTDGTELNTTIAYGNITVPADAKAGIYVAELKFPSVIYRLNVTTVADTNTGEFIRNGTVMQWNITRSQGFAPRFPNNVYPDYGTEFVVTGSSPLLKATTKGADTIQIPDAGFYEKTYDAATVKVYVRVADSGSPLGFNGYRDVNASANQTAFVFEKVNVTATNVPVDPVLTLFSSGQNPQVINSISGTKTTTGTYFHLTEAAVGGHYGKYVVGNDPTGADSG